MRRVVDSKRNFWSSKSYVVVELREDSLITHKTEIRLIKEGCIT